MREGEPTIPEEYLIPTKIENNNNKKIHHEKMVEELTVDEKEISLTEEIRKIEVEYDKEIDELSRDLSDEAKEFIGKVKDYFRTENKLRYYYEKSSIEEEKETLQEFKEVEDRINGLILKIFTEDERKRLENERRIPRLLKERIKTGNFVLEEKDKMSEILDIMKDEKIEILEALNITDTLTGAKNIRGFKMELKKEIAETERGEKTFVVGMIDVNHFKKFNDNYGHETGDKVLQVLTQTLKRGIREYDTLARVGGDEFSIIFHNMDLTELGPRLIKLNEQLEGLWVKTPSGEKVKIEISGGFEEFRPGMTSKEFLGQADEKLMKKAKSQAHKTPGNVFVFREIIEGGERAEAAA